MASEQWLEEETEASGSFWGQSSRDRENQGPQGRSRHVSEDLEGYGGWSSVSPGSSGRGGEDGREWGTQDTGPCGLRGPWPPEEVSWEHKGAAEITLVIG